jgi:hypothetical protein
MFFHIGFGFLIDRFQITALLLCGKHTSAVALTVNIVFFTHFDRPLIAGIFLEIAWQIMGIVNFLNIHPDLIDQLAVLFRRDRQGAAEIIVPSV